MRKLLTVAGMACVVSFAVSCKKDCDLADLDSKYFETVVPSSKKETCYYKRVGANVEVKNIAELKGLKAEIERISKPQSGTADGTAFKETELKNIWIAVKEPIVVTPDDYAALRSLKDLQASFAKITLYFNQNGQVVCPRDANTPLACEEVKQWTWNATQKLEIGINPWTGSRFLADDIDCFTQAGYNPDQLNRIIKDTTDVRITALSTDQLNDMKYMVKESKDKKDNKYFRFTYINDVSFAGSQEELLAGYKEFETNKTLLPDTLGTVITNGYGIYPANMNIYMLHPTWTGKFNKVKLGKHPNGTMFIVKCDQEKQFNDDGLTTTDVVQIDFTNCTERDTIRASNWTEVRAAPGAIKKALQNPEPNKEVYYQLNGRVGIGNGYLLNSIDSIQNFIKNGDVKFLKNGSYYFSKDSVYVNNNRIQTVVDMTNNGTLEANKLDESGFPYAENLTSQNITDIYKTNQIWRTNKMRTSDGLDVSKIIPGEIEADIAGAISATPFVTLANNNWKFDIKLSTTVPGVYIVYVNNAFIHLLQEPAKQAKVGVPYKIISSTNQILGRHVANKGVSNYDGNANTTFDIDDGDFTGNAIYAGWLKACAEAGATVYPQRVSQNAQVQSTFYTNNTNHIEDTSGRIYFAWTDLLPFVSSCGGRFLFNNAVTYTSDMNVWLDYYDFRRQGNVAGFYAQYGLTTTNVEMINTDYLPLDPGKTGFQPADPNSLQPTAVKAGVRGRR